MQRNFTPVQTLLWGRWKFHGSQKILKKAFLELQHPPRIQAINGQLIGDGKITYYTETATLNASALHQESISFLIIIVHKHMFILGNPWLWHHDPLILWKLGSILKWSRNCQNKCLQLPQLFINSTTTESPETQTAIHIPPQYQDYLDVFRKAKATSLPPQHEYDCVIE